MEDALPLLTVPRDVAKEPLIPFQQLLHCTTEIFFKKEGKKKKKR